MSLRARRGFTPYHFSVLKSDKGFTLVEMIVAVALFAVVMLISVGTLLALVGANRKAQALQSVINNLNITLDGMVRAIRMGSNFHCGEGTYTSTQNCPSGDTTFAFEPFGNTLSDPPTIYWLGTDLRIYKSESGLKTPGGLPVTAPEVSIESMKFYVVGTTRGAGDPYQPKVVIVIKGAAAPAGSTARTSFHIQATAVQRLLDL